MSKNFKEILSSLSKHIFSSKEDIYPPKNPNECFDERDLSKNKTKTVYRLCTEKELNCFENNDKSNLGNYFISFSKQPNTHKYKDDEKYLHFFDNREDAKNAINDLSSDKSYLCSFNISTSVLRDYKGFGYYSPSGYDCDYVKIKEYAIPVSEFDIDSFCDSVSIKDLFEKQENISETPSTQDSFQPIQPDVEQN